jgi:hypothetical protein
VVASAKAYLSALNKLVIATGQVEVQSEVNAPVAEMANQALY